MGAPTERFTRWTSSFSMSLLSRSRVKQYIGGASGSDGMAETDNQLLDRYAAGAEPAFEELVRRHQRTIYDLAYRMLENHADAADLAQRTFVQAFLHIRSFRRESSFRTWLFQIGLNLCRNAIRDRARLTHESVDELPLPAPQDVFKATAEAEMRDRLGSAIRTLPDRQREALVLRIYHNHPFAEIGAIMNCSEGTAKANYHHAVNKLRRVLVGSEGRL
jgi:RNA polymerase sigma-70 factor, ECF subfamily